VRVVGARFPNKKVRLFGRFLGGSKLGKFAHTRPPRFELEGGEPENPAEKRCYGFDGFVIKQYVNE
jgi:hypothetical protein